MSQTQKVVLAAVAVVVVVFAAAILWWSAQPEPVRVAVEPVAPIGTEVGARGGEGLVRAGAAGTRPNGLPRRPVLRPGQVDTGDPTRGEDTGPTREGMIDEMIDDLAKDTGLTEEGRLRMEEALLRARDGALPEEAP